MSDQKLLEYFSGDQLAVDVIKRKYLLKDLDGEQVETHPDQKHKRLAKEFARIHKKLGGPLTLQSIYLLFENYKGIIPQGSVMSSLGDPYRFGSLSNCIVVPSPFDSYGGILYTDQQLVQLMKRRCGVGVDISTLRPSGEKVLNTAGTSTGAVSFMGRFSHTTTEVAQEGRRGALMITLHVDHPDIMKFIKIKRDTTKVTGANISIQLSEKFMQAVLNDEHFDLEWEGTIYEVVKAKDLWDEIVKSAHECAEPGLMFADQHHLYNPSNYYPGFEDITTNPCGEIMMGHDSCRLLVLNMFECVIDPFTKQAKFDYKKWSENCEAACWLGDDLIELEAEAIRKILKKIAEDPEPELVKAPERELWENLLDIGLRGRRVGIGFTGLGDTLAAMGVPYDHKEALVIIGLIMETKLKAELDAQADLAHERGPFPAWTRKLDEENSFEEDSFWYFVKINYPDRFKRLMRHGRRSISWSTVAPTGSVSMLTQTTSGIEPLFAPYYTRRRKINPDEDNTRVDFVDEVGVAWMEYPVLHFRFKDWIENHTSFGIRSDVMIAEHLSAEELDKYFAESPWFGCIAPDIDWTQRVAIQAVIQKYTTHSISSTINLPMEATLEDVSTIYLEAYKQNLKGITVYRDGSRSGVLITDAEAEFDYNDAPKRPKEIPCDIHRVMVQGKKWVVFIGKVNNLPYEVFAIPDHKLDVAKKHSSGVLKKVKSKVYNLIVKNGVLDEYINITQYMSNAQENITRLTSLALRHGARPRYLVEQLDKSYGVVTDFSKAISRTFKKHYISEGDQKIMIMKGCPEDGNHCNIVLQEGCATCMQCGNSKCN
jgi:ribonucleoside-diphosphate reductase alpha chain